MLGAEAKMLLLAMLACVDEEEATDNCDAPPNERDAPDAEAGDAAAASNRLGLDLLRARTDENAFLAPLNITTALGMTLAGAAGNTRDELRAALGFAGEDAALHDGLAGLGDTLGDASFGGEGCPTRTLAGDAAAFVDARLDLHAPYEATLADVYGAAPVEVDYEGAPADAAEAINAWASDVTAGHVTEIADPAAYDYHTLLVLATAVYFEGKWAEPFDPALTVSDRFLLPDGAARDAMMMEATATRRWGRVDGAYVVELPYRGEDVSMVLVVPDEVDGLDAVLDALDPSALDAAVVDAYGQGEITVVLPRFEVRSRASLVPALQALGVVDLFDGAVADLSAMAAPPAGFDNLYVADVTHEAWIQVEESGTVAAAATTVEVDGNDSDAPMPEVVRADHPFLYVVRDRVTDAWLFAGRLDVPPEE